MRGNRPAQCILNVYTAVFRPLSRPVWGIPTPPTGFLPAQPLECTGNTLALDATQMRSHVISTASRPSRRVTRSLGEMGSLLVRFTPLSCLSSKYYKYSLIVFYDSSGSIYVM